MYENMAKSAYAAHSNVMYTSLYMKKKKREKRKRRRKYASIYHHLAAASHL